MKFLKVNLNENITRYTIVFGYICLVGNFIRPREYGCPVGPVYHCRSGDQSEARIRNLNAKPSGVVKGTFEGRELTFKKFDGIHELLSVPGSGKEARVTPLGGRVRGGVKSGFKRDKPDANFINETFSTNSPHINAIAFENKSIFEAVSIVGEPYYFYNTKYFTNSGTFRVYDTFDFRTYETYENLLGEIDYDPVEAEVFDNQQGGVLVSAAPSIVSGGLRVESALIKNQGIISAPSAGILQFKGETVDLSSWGDRNQGHPDLSSLWREPEFLLGLHAGLSGQEGLSDWSARRECIFGHYGMPESYWGVTPYRDIPGSAWVCLSDRCGSECLHTRFRY